MEEYLKILRFNFSCLKIHMSCQILGRFQRHKFGGVGHLGFRKIVSQFFFSLVVLGFLMRGIHLSALECARMYRNMHPSFLRTVIGCRPKHKIRDLT